MLISYLLVLTHCFSLLSGDCKGNILLTLPKEGGFQVEKQPFKGHQSSVEDVAWSPAEPVFASCSSDKTVKFWDQRAKKPAMSFKAADCDVNVISWNK